MRNQHIQRPHWTFPALIIILIVAGCSGSANAPTSAPTSPPTSIPVASPTDLIVESTPTAAPIADENILYHDDFASPGSGWSENKLDDYFVGYHEPEYYHFEITSPNDHETIFGPDKQSFGDATVEIKVFTVSKKTAAEGDFRYGIALRRSGDQYYAFTISPRTKKWYVLKSSPTALEVLAEGTEESIHDLDTEDVLRVDAQGPNFSFYINNKPVGRITEANYTAGEVGFYVETFDAPNIHIHFDQITISKFEIPVACTVNAAIALNVRSGPGTRFPSSDFVTNGQTVEPLGRSADATWIKIKLAESGNQGWIYYSTEFATCSIDVNTLPVINE